MTQIGRHETYFLVLILSLIALAFGLQNLLLGRFPALTQDHIPVIVFAYLLAATFRLTFSVLFPFRHFPEKTLTRRQKRKDACCAPGQWEGRGLGIG